MELLFSYGTLQFEKVQLESFGRLLTGKSETLEGYRLGEVEIKDPEVLRLSAKRFHPIAIPCLDEQIEGMVFEITHEELLRSDSYEVEEYTRQAIPMKSGLKAWVYVSSAHL